MATNIWSPFFDLSSYLLIQMKYLMFIELNTFII
jgi:hypothetical protein